MVQINAVPLCFSRLDATVMSNHSTLQPLNPDKASDRPIGTNPYRVSKWPMRTCPIAWLSGVQVAKGKCGTIDNRTRGGPISHATLFRMPPPLKVEWQEGSGIHLSTIDQGELISTIRELHVRFRTPPPLTAKGRTARGLRNGTSAIDLGGWTLVVQIYSLLTLMHIRTPT
jgi:hypothetical protein